MVDRAEHEFGAAQFAARITQSREGLRTRHFVNEVAVDIKERQLAGLFGNDVCVVDLFV